MDKKTALKITEILTAVYPDPIPALKYTTAYELLIAVILSAQCTDERVNKVTEVLFKRANTPEEMAKMPQEELEKYIFPCGLYRSKASHIISASKDIVDKFMGEVPSSLEDLRSLAGVGRKTANVVYSVAFKGSAIAVDTHVFRVSNRIGLVNADNVLNTEKGLMKVLDKDDWSRAHHYLIYLGRSFCKAQKPNCQDCPIQKHCKKKIKR